MIALSFFGALLLGQQVGMSAREFSQKCGGTYLAEADPWMLPKVAYLKPPKRSMFSGFLLVLKDRTKYSFDVIYFQNGRRLVFESGHVSQKAPKQTVNEVIKSLSPKSDVRYSASSDFRFDLRLPADEKKIEAFSGKLQYIAKTMKVGDFLLVTFTKGTVSKVQRGANTRQGSG